MRTNEIKNELDDNGGWKKKLEKKKKIKMWNKHLPDFQQLEKIRSFGESIISGRTTISEDDKDQSYLLENIVEFNNNLDQERNRVWWKKLFLIV